MTDEAYDAAVRDVRHFLDGKTKELLRDLRQRMESASEDLRFEEAGRYRDVIATVEEMEQKQKMAAAHGENIDIFASYAEPPLVAVNLFHLRNGHIVDRHEYFWEDRVVPGSGNPALRVRPGPGFINIIRFRRSSPNTVKGWSRC
ncbi:MAG: UvrB/UvrC motif-containing protein [Bryobacterales bacterium]|nr:UvrB/UvrC motif-containing protein [Bryobacterales bacterium]